jgi:hypothetical protein
VTKWSFVSLKSSVFAIGGTLERIVLRWADTQPDQVRVKRSVCLEA